MNQREDEFLPGAMPINQFRDFLKQFQKPVSSSPKERSAKLVVELREVVVSGADYLRVTVQDSGHTLPPAVTYLPEQPDSFRIIEEIGHSLLPSAIPSEVRQWALENSTAEAVQNALKDAQQHGSVELGETLRRRKERHATHEHKQS